MNEGSAVLLSVNVGGIRQVEWRGRLISTGIWKTTVGDAPMAVRGVNLQADDQADRIVHGGPDKAVYAYAAEDYLHWHEVQGVATAPGLFGENLTTSGVSLTHAVVGERWRVGSALLEVAQPRLPCFKLGVRMNDAGFPRRFMQVGLPGAYLRIIEEGVLRRGDAIDVIERPAHGITLRNMMEAVHDPARAPLLRMLPRLPEWWRQFA
ncbi:MAG: hypothetical protein JWO05_2509 [Gemmatimonadetes bacterium]|nr:hypothetical protein [Gemmatimonadota bacterium]